MNHNLKLSKRLQQIQNMVTSQYDHIWDGCCDHGLLGFSLLTSQANSTVHFIDIVPKLMVNLESKLKRFCPSLPWKTHCIDVATLPLAQYQGKHLVIISGVGGDLMIQFIDAIYQQNKNLNIDFLLCPVHHQFSLRQKLITLNFSLKDEVLIEENQRYYEILLVSSSGEKLSNESSKISPVGDKIWQSTSQEQTKTIKKYLQKTLGHYQRIQQGYLQGNQSNKADKVQQILDDYNAIEL